MMYHDSRADYKIVEETENYIYIEDQNLGNRSVTNDAINVVADLAAHLGDRRLYYRDSLGDIDEIMVKDSIFSGFCMTENADLSRLRKHYQK